MALFQAAHNSSRGRVGPGMPPLHPNTDEPFLSERNLRFVTSLPQVQRTLQCLRVKEHTPKRDTPGSPTSPPSLHSSPLATHSLWASPKDTLLFPARVTSRPLSFQWIFPDRPLLSLLPCFPDSSPPGNSIKPSLRSNCACRAAVTACLQLCCIVLCTAYPCQQRSV